VITNEHHDLEDQAACHNQEQDGHTATLQTDPVVYPSGLSELACCEARGTSGTPKTSRAVVNFGAPPRLVCEKTSASARARQTCLVNTSEEFLQSVKIAHEAGEVWTVTPALIGVETSKLPPDFDQSARRLSGQTLINPTQPTG